MRPIHTLSVACLYFNKVLFQFERNLQRMIQHASQSGVISTLHIITHDGTAVDMARNGAVATALHEQNADAVVWLDTDMLYPDYAITRLVQLSNRGHAIAAGLYRRARGDKQILAELKWDQRATLEDLQAAAVDGLVRCEMAAGGFSIVRNEVYQDVCQKVGMPWYCNWDFRTGREQVGEDRFFMLRAIECGYYPMVDVALHALHWPPMTGPVPVTPNDPLLRLCE